MIESAERHAVAGCLVCVASLVVLVTAAYEIGPVVRLDDSVLSALRTPPGSLLNEAAFGVEQLVAPFAWVVAAALACLLAIAARRIGPKNRRSHEPRLRQQGPKARLMRLGCEISRPS